MTDHRIDAYFAENGLLSTIEVLLAAPDSLGVSETEAEMKLRMIGHILTVPREVAENVARLTDIMHTLGEDDRRRPN